MTDYKCPACGTGYTIKRTIKASKKDCSFRKDQCCYVCGWYRDDDIDVSEKNVYSRINRRTLGEHIEQWKNGRLPDYLYAVIAQELYYRKKYPRILKRLIHRELIKDTEYSCPVCQKYRFEEWGDFDICCNCGWENDNLQLKYPNLSGGANHESLNEAREMYELTGEYVPGWRNTVELDEESRNRLID